MNNYWIDRINRQNEINFNKTVSATDKKLIKLYQNAAKEIRIDMIELLDSLDKPIEEIKINDLYKNNRYYDLLNKINKQLTLLGIEEIDLLDEDLIEMYETTSSLVNEEARFNLTFDNPAKQVTDRIWCPDGKHWSTRIWTNKTKMQVALEQGLVDCLARGLSKDKIVSEISNITNNQRYMADRLVRTELTFIQNEACADTYEKAGITQYKYLAALDDRTSKICRETNGKIFNFRDKKVGVNFPPLHANCRCTITPIVNI